MNTKELRVEMIRHDDTTESLAEFLEISRVSMIRKLNCESSFKQEEMVKIKKRYDLSTERFVEIFYAEEVKV